VSNFVEKLLAKYLSRKLVKSYIVLTLSYIALMNGKINGQEWILAAGLCLAVYTYGNIKEATAAKTTE